MIALLAAAATLLAPPAVLAKYATALAALREPRTFVVEYTLAQSGARSLEQTHRVFRRGGDERDETIAINGTRTTKPQVRIFRGRPYRYTVATLAPRATQYAFAYAGAVRAGRHVDYVFRLTPKSPAGAFARTEVRIDGITFLPTRVSFRTSAHGGSGTIGFAKAEKWWVAQSATARARLADGRTASETLSFVKWRFPASLPASTFALRPRPAPVSPPPGD